MGSEQLIDAAGKVRAGEEVDLAKVTAFLKAADMALEGEPQLKQFPGGASNLTYLVSYANKDLILRRPPFGHIAKSAHDVVPGALPRSTTISCRDGIGGPCCSTSA